MSNQELLNILQRLADESAFYLPNLSEAAPDQRRRLVRAAAEEIERLYADLEAEQDA